MDPSTFTTIERQRATEDGKACVRTAAHVAALADGAETAREKVELLGEARQWIKLGLEHDKASDSKLLRELAERLAKKERRRSELRDLREGTRARDVGAKPRRKRSKAKEIDGET